MLSNPTKVAARLTLRNATQEKWATENPILLKGEAGYDLTSKVLKIGDGVTEWLELQGVAASIATATSTTIGGVRSSDDDNRVKVLPSGLMEINYVSTSKLFVPLDDNLVLNGGTSNNE